MKIGQEGFEASVRTEDDVIEFACDKSGRGLFRLSKDRTEWRQVEGLLDTPVFKSAAELKHYAADRFQDE